MEAPPNSDPPSRKLKAVLLQSSSESGLNLYEHLVGVLMKVMDEQPPNAVDIFEDLSGDVKQCWFEERRGTLRDLPQSTSTELLAEQQHRLFSPSDQQDQEEELVETALPNVSELGFFLQQAGVSLGSEEMTRIALALKQLVDSEALLRCRLWGKILGRMSSYIVAEAECREGMEEEEQSAESTSDQQEKDQDTQENQEDLLPQANFKAPPVVPQEAPGTGANKFAYYVCNQPGLPWVKLPLVSPAQITAARLIRQLFTGRLDSAVESYPPFPGNEANYLRAQIARISASTQVSPLGYYQLVEEEGDEEEDAPRDTVEVNPDFEGIPAAEMSESLSAWVHQSQHILQQGRCTWVNLAQKAGDDSNEEAEGDEREEEADEPEPEVGPPLLTPLSQDTELFSTPPWSPRLSSRLIPQFAVAVLRSNLWPGAVTYACGKKFDSIYVGWGLKYAGDGHSPALPPLPQREYPSGPEITEAADPSIEEEQELREALEEQEETQEDMDESGDEDEDDDEDDN